MATTIDEPLSPAEPYRLPELLRDIRLLDLLELSGSTVQASRLLNLSQPSVSRRYRLLAQDFGLERSLRPRQLCRYGSSETMRWLRLGCRAHRLAAGFARISTDPLHQPLLSGLEGLLPTPVRFRSIHTWAALVHQGVVDAALISGLEVQQAGSKLDRRGLQWLELGALPLGLAVTDDLGQDDSRQPAVLVPQRSVAPGLHGLLRHQGLSLRAAGNGCSTAEQWQRKTAKHGLAIPTYRGAAGTGNGTDHLQVKPLPGGIQGAVGVLLPADASTVQQLRQPLDALRRQINTVRAGIPQSSPPQPSSNCSFAGRNP